MQPTIEDGSDTANGELESSVISVLARMGKPMSPSKVRGALPKKFQRPPKELRLILDRLVEQRRAFKGGSAKTPTYAERDPAVVAEEAVLAELERGPVVAARLTKSVKVVLQRLIDERRIHARHKLAKNGKPTKTVDCYVLGPPPAPTPPPRERAEAAILELLQREPVPAAQLKKEVTARVLGLNAKDLTSALRSLIDQRRIHARHRLGKNGKPTKDVESYAFGGPSADSFVTEPLAALEAAFRAAEPFGVSPAAIVAALLARSKVDPKQIGADLGRSAAPGNVSSSDQEIVLSKLAELVAKERSGALIPIRRLRSWAGLEPARFDAVVIGLARSGAVILHHHDFPAGLPENERRELVVDAYGTHYVGIALGRSS